VAGMAAAAAAAAAEVSWAVRGPVDVACTLHRPHR